MLTTVCVALAAVALYCCADQLSLLRTLLLGAAAAMVAIPLGSIIAYALTRSGRIARLLFVACVCLAFFPLFLHVSVWDAAFGKLGWLTSARGEALTPLVSGWTAAIWIHGIAATPQVAIVFLLGWTFGQPAYAEQARLDANRWQEFASVTVPRMLPLVFLSVVWILLTCSREIAVTDLYQIGTVAEQVYLGYSLGGGGSILGNWSPDELQSAASIRPGWSLILFGGLAVAMVLQFMQLSGIQSQLDINHVQPPQRGGPTAMTRIAGVLSLSLLVLVPLVNTVYRCGFNVRPVDGTPVAGFDVVQLSTSLVRACTRYTSEFQWSLIIAAVSATAILVLSSVFIWQSIVKNRTRWLWTGAFMLLLAFTCCLPGPIIGKTLAELIGDSSSQWVIWLYDRTVFAPVIANVVFCWPLAAMLNWFLLNNIDRDVIDSSRLDGASWFQSLLRIGVIGNRRMLAGSWLLTFALCFGELSASQMVLPPGIDTLPRLMLGLLHAGVDEMTAGLAIVGGVVISLCTLVGLWLIGPRLRRT